MRSEFWSFSHWSKSVKAGESFNVWTSIMKSKYLMGSTNNSYQFLLPNNWSSQCSSLLFCTINRCTHFKLNSKSNQIRLDLIKTGYCRISLWQWPKEKKGKGVEFMESKENQQPYTLPKSINGKVYWGLPCHLDSIIELEAEWFCSHTFCCQGKECKLLVRNHRIARQFAGMSVTHSSRGMQ